jgi:hypothetical protein
MNISPTYHDFDKPKKTTGVKLVGFCFALAVAALLVKCFTGCATTAPFSVSGSYGGATISLGSDGKSYNAGVLFPLTRKNGLAK